MPPIAHHLPPLPGTLHDTMKLVLFLSFAVYLVVRSDASLVGKNVFRGVTEEANFAEVYTQFLNSIALHINVTEAIVLLTIPPISLFC